MLTHGDLPDTDETSLLWDMSEMRTKNVLSARGRRVSGILRFRKAVAPGDRLTLYEMDRHMVRQNDVQIRTMSIRILDRDGEIHSFGNDSQLIISISVASPAVVTTAIAHGLTTGDVVRIRAIDNMSTTGRNAEINAKFVVTVTGGSTFTIPVDTTSQSASQVLTGIFVAPYPLGSRAIIQVLNGLVKFISLIETDGSGGSRLTFTAPHGYTQFTTIHPTNPDLNVYGSRIVITGMDNGATNTDNNRINKPHNIKAIPNATQIDIVEELSDYTTPRSPTSIAAPYLLGSKGRVLVEEFQVCLDFLITLGGKKREITHRYTHPADPSTRRVIENNY